MQYLWGLINTLQIILHVPIVRLYFPPHAKILYAFLIDIAQFDLVNTDALDNYFFDFEKEDAYSDEYSELDIFEIYTFFLNSALTDNTI